MVSLSPALHRPLVAACLLIATRAVTAALWSAYWARLPEAGLAVWFALLAALDVTLLCVAVFWVWRVAKNHSGTGASLVLFGLALAVSVAGLTTLLNHGARYAAKPAPPPPPLARLIVTGTDAYLTGPLDFESFNALKATLTDHPELSRLILDSDGGRIAAARGLARLVTEAGLDTHIEASCASACTLVFLAGTHRTLGPDGSLGFHGYRLNSTVPTLDADEEQSRDARFMQRRGVTPEFTARAFATPHEAMWFPGRATLVQAGVLTAAP